MKSAMVAILLALLLVTTSSIVPFPALQSVEKTEYTPESVEIMHYTPVQTVNFSFGVFKGKMGSTVEYDYIGPATERTPRYYAGVIARVNGTESSYLQRITILVNGTDPNGNPLPPDRFINPSILSSPDGSDVLQEIFEVISRVLVGMLPYGLDEAVKYTYTKAGSYWDWTDEYLKGEVIIGPSQKERGLRLGFDLKVYPEIEGIYTVNIYCEAEHRQPSGPGYAYYITKTYHTLTYEYVNTPNTPQPPSGDTEIRLNHPYSYSAKTTDPNSDMLRYEFDWGDGSTTLTDWHPSGEEVNETHTWTKNQPSFEVKVRAQDSTGVYSAWSNPLTVNVVYKLNITIINGEGTVDPSPGIYWLPAGTEVTLTATPADGYGFHAWIYNSEPTVTLVYEDGLYLVLMGGHYSNPFDITMNEDVEIGLIFNPVMVLFPVYSSNGEWLTNSCTISYKPSGTSSWTTLFRPTDMDARGDGEITLVNITGVIVITTEVTLLEGATYEHYNYFVIMPGGTYDFKIECPGYMPRYYFGVEIPSPGYWEYFVGFYTVVLWQHYLWGSCGWSSVPLLY